MGCGASKSAVDTVEEKSMTEVSNKKTAPAKSAAPVKTASAATPEPTLAKPNSVAFEIPVDDLKVAAAQPQVAVADARTSRKSLDRLDAAGDAEALKQKIKEKGEQMEQNRQQELDKVAEKAKKRDEQMRRAAERKKKFQAEGGKGSPLGSNDKLQDE